MRLVSTAIAKKKKKKITLLGVHMGNACLHVLISDNNGCLTGCLLSYNFLSMGENPNLHLCMLEYSLLVNACLCHA